MLNTPLSRLRLLAHLEGLSFLVLLFIAEPAKHFFGEQSLVRYCGTIHGLLFLLFVLNAFLVAVAEGWELRRTTWKVLLACIVPFGTFYIDRKILRKRN